MSRGISARLPRCFSSARIRSTVIALVLAGCRTASHTDVPTNANAATLFSHCTAQGCAFLEPGESLGAEDIKHIGGYSRAETKGSSATVGLGARDFVGVSHILVGVLVVIPLDLFHEGKVQIILSFVAYAEIGKDEIACFFRSVQENHAGDGHASEHGRPTLRADTARVAIRGMVQACVEKEVGVVSKSDILGSLSVVTLKNPHLHHRRRVNRSTVGSGYIQVISHAR